MQEETVKGSLKNDAVIRSGINGKGDKGWGQKKLQKYE